MIPLEATCAEHDAAELARRHATPPKVYDPIPVLPAMRELDELLPKARTP